MTPCGTLIPPTLDVVALQFRISSYEHSPSTIFDATYNELYIYSKVKSIIEDVLDFFYFAGFDSLFIFGFTRIF